MPDPEEIDKDKEKKNPPQAQEGAPRDLPAIQADIVKAVLAGQPTEDLAKELVAAQALAGAQAASVPPAPTPEAPTMGMKPEDAYARVQAGYKEAVEAIVEANPHLDDKQKAMTRKQVTPAAARELVGTYTRPAPPPEAPTMGMRGHPSTPAGGGKKETPLARALSEAQGDALFRRAMGIGTADNDGIQYDVPGHITYIDGSERLRHQREAYRNRRAAK